jgi:hypothetical protein
MHLKEWHLEADLNLPGFRYQELMGKDRYYP